MRLVTLSLALVLLSAAVEAQTPGACALGTAQRVLDTPSLTAHLFNTGNLFFGGTTTNGDGYLVPRARQRSPLFVAGLWVGAHVGGDLRVAAARYTNFNFWPGPLDPGGTLPNPSDCSAWDRIYVVAPVDVATYENGGPAAPDLAEWPVGLGAPAVDAAGMPVVVTSRSQTLNLAAGERPVVYGGPTAFWVMNDVGNTHLGSGSLPLGVEVRTTAFAVWSGPEALRQATVYRYEIVNRNTVPLTDLHIGYFADPDLGFPVDDYVGTDTTRGLTYVYNADNFDEGAKGYGIPPAFGVDLLAGLQSSTYFVSGGPGPMTDPALAGPMYNFLQGLWGDGTPMRELGSGYNQPTSAPVTRYLYPGDPVTGQPWSAINNGTATPVSNPGDPRFVATAPSLTLAPGASHTVDLALVFAQGADHLASVTALRQASDLVQGRYDDGTLFSGDYVYTPPPPLPGATTLLTPAPDADFNDTRPPTLTFSWTPVAGAEAYRLEISTSPEFPDSPTYSQLVFATEISLGRVGTPESFGRWTYWRVTPTNFSGDGPTTDSRRFAYTLYPFQVTSFEVVANAAGPLVPSEPGAYADAGFPTPGGTNPSARQQATNSSEWSLHVGGANLRTFSDWLERVTRQGDNDPRIAGFDFEMRFTGTSLAAVTGVAGQTAPDFTVPFELWNTGRGTPDDPSDDVRLIPLLLDGGVPDLGGVPDGAFGAIRDAAGFYIDSPLSFGPGDPYTDWVSWYEPADTTPGTAGYDAYVAARTATPGDTTQIGGEVLAQTVLVSVNGRGLARRFPVPEMGTVFRISTMVPFVADEPAADASALSLGVYPNPVRRQATVPYGLPAAADVRLSVVDVLGREVAVLADGPQAAGPHTAVFEAAGLAAGVYVVVLRTDDARVVRRITVVR